eukprot:4310601-Prymnesium_polylepis.1
MIERHCSSDTLDDGWTPSRIVQSRTTHQDSAVELGEPPMAVAPTAVMLVSSVTSCNPSKKSSSVDAASVAAPPGWLLFLSLSLSLFDRLLRSLLRFSLISLNFLMSASLGFGCGCGTNGGVSLAPWAVRAAMYPL